MRTRKTLNKPLLRKLALKLRRLRHEEHYDQSAWFQKTSCGTAACLGGHLVQMAGWKLDLKDRQAETCTKGKERREIYAVARTLLGINMESGARLFSGSPEGSWPDPFAERWENASYGATKERPSRIAADLLMAIADGKVEL